jgi:F-type H+-transporting ATPase subunit b
MGELLRPDLTTILFEAVNFLILAGLLYYLLFKPVTAQIEARREERERMRREAMADREEASQLREELEARLAHAEEEAAQIISEAEQEAEKTRQDLQENAEREAERILAEAHRDTRQMRQQSTEDFYEELLDAILGISAQMIRRAAPAELHDNLVQQLSDRIWEMGRSEMARVEAFRRSLGDREPTAYVTTAQQLSPEQQGLLARTFTALADRHVNVELKTDEDLAAGLKVRLGDIVVDNSIRGQLEQLRDDAGEALERKIEHE